MLSTYPKQAEYVARAAGKIGATFEALDNGHGYLFRVSRDGRAFVSGCGDICTYPVNTATAYSIARDKAHTKRLLAGAGLSVIPGALFFCRDKFAALQPCGHQRADALDYAEKLGFPVFCKPNKGGRGDYAEIISSLRFLDDYMDRLAREQDGFLIEKLMVGDEYRILVKDDQVQFMAHRFPVFIEGDGITPLKELLGEINARLKGRGVSLYPLETLHNAGCNPQEVPEKGQRIFLPGRQNVSAGGKVDTISEAVPEELASIARRAVQVIGLRIGAVDFIDPGHRMDPAELRILEVNGNPEITALETNDRYDLIESIWCGVLEELLA